MNVDSTANQTAGQARKMRYPLLIGLAWCLLYLIGSGQVLADSWQVQVRWVPDGDTLYLKSGQKVRLKGIDAPETGHESNPRQYFALDSRKQLEDLVEGKSLIIEAETLNADHYGRLLAYVQLPDGRFLNSLLLRRGAAFFYPHPKQDQPHKEELLQNQQRAMHERRGFWSRILTMPAANQKFIGNSNSRRFHTADCPYGQRIKPDNQRPFSNLRQAFDAGYAPCRNCTPWPLE